MITLKILIIIGMVTSVHLRAMNSASPTHAHTRLKDADYENNHGGREEVPFDAGRWRNYSWSNPEREGVSHDNPRLTQSHQPPHSSAASSTLSQPPACPAGCSCISCLEKTEDYLHKYLTLQLPTIMYLRRQCFAIPSRSQDPLLTARISKAGHIAELLVKNHQMLQMGAVLVQPTSLCLSSSPVVVSTARSSSTPSTVMPSARQKDKKEKKNKQKNTRDARVDKALAEIQSMHQVDALVVLPEEKGAVQQASKTLLNENLHKDKHLEKK